MALKSIIALMVFVVMLCGRNAPIVIRTFVFFEELHLLSEQLEPTTSSHLSIAC